MLINTDCNSVLQMFKGRAYVVADGPAENIATFKDRYLRCFAHQLNNCFKFALLSMKKNSEDGPLMTTLEAIHDLTNHCNKSDSKMITFSYINTQETQIVVNLRNPSKTRWFGILDQAIKVLKVKDSILEKAETDEEIHDFSLMIDWNVLAE